MRLPLHIYTLALDAAKFLHRQLEVFKQINREWTWHVMEGVADNVKDTSWVAKIPPRLSRDGTTEWLNQAMVENPRIKVYRRQLWPGKTAMVNAAISRIQEPCVLLQVDSDEFWTAEQIEKMCSLYESGRYDRMRFYCRYFVGPDIVVTTTNTWSNRPGEWSRSWLFKPGMIAEKHEPPVLKGCGRRELNRDETLKLGLFFNHEAYMYADQIEFKERYYKYRGATDGWRRLQQNKIWPTKLKPFFNWVEDSVIVDKISK